MKFPERFYRDIWLVVVTGLVAWALFGQQGQIDRIDELARDTARLAKAIQSQRVNAIVTNCQDQNARHDDTIRKLNELIAAKPPGAERERAMQNKPGTVLLIDALVPKRDCEQVLEDATTPAPPEQFPN